MTNYFIGVDVGTGSARAGVVDTVGNMLATVSVDIDIHRAARGVVEQSGDQVWAAVCTAVRRAVSGAGVEPATIRGLGFVATCSLVVRGKDGGPLPVGDPEHPERDIIVWMDHRALEQAAHINARDHNVLKYVGGRISPEMQTPKLLWLKENRPETYGQAANFFDLTDFLGWKATGSLARSACTVTCKWTYLGHEGRWDSTYFGEIGLNDLAEDDFARIGQDVVAPGTALGSGLTDEAARDLGLMPGISVGAGLIDAHAGGVGTVGAAGDTAVPSECLAYVFGTSSCTMTTTAEPIFVPGIWGPYYSAMIPGMWLNEGGQSAAGAAIDHLVTLHPAHTRAAQEASKSGKSLPGWLADRALDRAGQASDVVRLTDELHVVPEFLGNRAPFADPGARAVVVGQGMDMGLDSLVALYVAGICGLAYGLRQIIETQVAHGAPVKAVAISGGAGKHLLIRQVLADAIGLPVFATTSDEPVLIGAAILGTVASGAFPDIRSAMSAMTSVRTTYIPSRGVIGARHDTRYAAFLRLQKLARDIREATAGTNAA